VSSSSPTSLYKYNEYLLANRVCSVSKSGNATKPALMYYIRQPSGSFCRDKKACMMEKVKNAAKVVTSRIKAEVAHGLRRRFGRGRLCFVCVAKAGFVASSEGDRVTFHSAVSFSLPSHARLVLSFPMVNTSSSDVSRELPSTPPDAPISLDFLLLDSFIFPCVRALVCVVSTASSCAGEA